MVLPNTQWAKSPKNSLKECFFINSAPKIHSYRLFFRNFSHYFSNTESGHMNDITIIGKSNFNQLTVDEDDSTCQNNLVLGDFLVYELGGLYNITKVEIRTGIDTGVEVYLNKVESNLCFTGTINGGMNSILSGCIRDDRRFIRIKITTPTGSLCTVKAYREYNLMFCCYLRRTSKDTK